MCYPVPSTGEPSFSPTKMAVNLGGKSPISRQTQMVSHSLLKKIDGHLEVYPIFTQKISYQLGYLMSIADFVSLFLVEMRFFLGSQHGRLSLDLEPALRQRLRPGADWSQRHLGGGGSSHGRCWEGKSPFSMGKSPFS